MLEAIRKRTGSFVVKGLAMILIISFGAWGIGDFVQSGISEEIVAEIGDVEITPIQIENEIVRELKKFQQQSGVYLDRQQLKAFGIAERIIQRLINVAAIDLEVEQMGLVVSESTVVKNIQANPSFFGITGNFDKQRFNSVIQSEGFSEKKYIFEARRELARTQLLGSFDKAIFPRAIAEEFFKIQSEKRTAKAFLITDKEQKNIVTPDNTALLKFYNEQKEMFTSPETRKVSYIYISVDQLANDISVTDEEILSYYEDNKDEFFKPEYRRIRQFIVNEKDAADKASARLASGSKFIDVAREIGDREPSDLDLGLLARNDLPIAEVADSAFALSSPGFAKVVKSALGFHILEIIEIQAAEQKTETQARKIIVPIIQNEKGIDILFKLSNRLEDTLGSGATLEEAAIEIGTKIKTISGLDKSGIKLSADTQHIIPSKKEFTEIAFATEIGIESPLTEAGQDGYYILRVDDISERALKPLESIKSDVTNAWMVEARKKASEVSAKNFVELLKNGKKIGAGFSKKDKKVELIGPVTREGNKKIQATVLETIFTLKTQEVGMARVDNGYKVIQVMGADVPDPKAHDEAVNDIVLRLNSSYKNDLVTQFVDALRSNYGVSVNRDTIDLIFQPGGYKANRS